MAVHLVGGAGGIDLAVGNPADVSHLPPVSVDIADLLASGAGAGFQPLGLPALRARRSPTCTPRPGCTPTPRRSTSRPAPTRRSPWPSARWPGGASRSPPRRPATRASSTSSRASGTASCRCAPTAPASCPSRSGRRSPTAASRSCTSRPGAQNPTGVVTSPARLRALAAVLDEHDATVIEDPRWPSWCSPAARRPTSPASAGGPRWCRSGRSARCCGAGCASAGCGRRCP